MVNKLSISDIDRFKELGLLINSNFNKVYPLETLLESLYDYLFGYYKDNKLVGFIHVNKLYENMDIVNIVVDPLYRRKGIGQELIRYSIDFFDDVKSVMLEVNENNKAAISLYLENGFEVISKREKYYGDDTALIMKRDV